MKLKIYVVAVELTRRQRAFISPLIVFACVDGTLGIAIASPHKFSTGEQLQATSLNTLNVAANATQLAQPSIVEPLPSPLADSSAPRRATGAP